MTVFLVGAGPGDPGLLTRRGAEVLARADVVLFDRLVDPRLLDLAPGAALRVDVGKRPGERRRQDEVSALMVAHARAGRTVVRLKGGDPFVFGRGGEEAEALAAAGIDFEVVPGVSSAFAAPAAAGVPVTHRRLSSSVTVVTGHVGDPGSPGAVDWDSLARVGGTIVVMMGMAARAEIARRLMAAGRPPDTPVAVVERGTTPEQVVVRTTLAGLPEVELGPPCTIVVGSVAALDLGPVAAARPPADRRPPDDLPPPVPGAARDRPLAGLRVVVTRARPQADALAHALEREGAEVVALPVIAVTDPPDGGDALRAAAADAGRYDWVVFTSANAVERFLAALPDVRSLAGVFLAAVGPATARALAVAHLVADAVPVEHSAEGLVAALAARSPERPLRALFPRAEDARPVLAPGLRRLGWEVTEVVAYRTAAAGPEDGLTPAALDDALDADVVTFTSPSTVARFVELAAGRRLPPLVACIGPVTAEAARGAGLAVDVVAPDAGVDALVGALVEARRDSGWSPDAPA